MTNFVYNNMEFTVKEDQGAWSISYKNADGKTSLMGARLFAGMPSGEIASRARKLVETVFPVGVRCVGPDVTHPMMVGDLKIVPPDVAHPNFIYWDKESASFPK